MRNLNEISREYLIEQGRSSLHKLQHVMQIGSRAMNELNIDVTGVLKTVHLTPNSYGAFDAPDDMQSWSKVALCENGELFILTVNNAMCFPHEFDACGNLQPDSFDDNLWQQYVASSLTAGWGNWLYNWTSVNEYGEVNAKTFGMGSGFNSLGCFRYKPTTRQFFVSPQLMDREIVLEYFSNGLNQELILVPDEATETVISFMNWKTSRGNERLQFKAEYYANLMVLQQRSFSFNLADFIAATRKGFHLAAKA